MTFTTAKYSVSRSRLLRSAVAVCHGRHLCLVLGLLLVIGVAFGLLIDWRFALVTAMLALVLAPGVLAFLFFNYALSPRCLPEVWPHTVTFTTDGFEVTATVPPLPDAGGGDGTDAEEGRETPPARIGYAAAYTDVREVRAGVDGLVIRLAGTPPGLLHVPYSALPELRENTAYILEKCRRR